MSVTLTIGISSTDLLWLVKATMFVQEFATNQRFETADCLAFHLPEDFENFDKDIIIA